MSEPATEAVANIERPAALRVAPWVERRRFWRLLSGIAGLLGLLAAWEGLTWLVAYTDDGYVRSDLVAVAPQVGGVIVAVPVTDNQEVHRGDLLAVVDKVPFALTVDERQAGVQEAIAEEKADQDDRDTAQARLDAAAAALRYATEEQQRVAALIKDDVVSRQQFDQANEVRSRGQAEQAVARAAVDKASQSMAKHAAATAKARAGLGFAQWQFSQTEIRAPVDGSVNNLTVRVGDTAQAGTAIIGVVDASAWRIVANFKESYIRRLHPGDIAWVWLDTHPWRLYRARIQGIARGISRSQAPDALLPYVAATTDWIRLTRRFPVTLTLVDPPPDLRLYMGADASTLIFP